MSNLRIISVTVADSTHVTAVFTEPLSQAIGVANILIKSQTPGVPDSQPLLVSIANNTLNITTQPLTPLAAYFITFQSTTQAIFKSLNGDAVLPNDGVANKQFILGPAQSDDPVINYLNTFFANNVYDTTQPSAISTYLRGIGGAISKALYSIRQAGNENYLSFTVTDEQKTRGPGPFDRLNSESAYEVLRVGTTPTGTTQSNTTSVNQFPLYPVSLLATTNTESLTASSSGLGGTFNLENFVLTLSKRYVISVQNIIFVYNSASAPYAYNIDGYGYQILDSKYDPNYAFTYTQLTDSQIKLNDQVLNDPNFSIENISYIQITYQFKDTGKNIDTSTLSIDTVLSSGREVLPPIENIFTLKYAPIVNTNDTAGSVGSITFTDPNALPGSNAPHPAFTLEIPYRLDYLPSLPGQYSVDYTTGNVYVYGASSSQDGTGPYPPLASYSYRYVFKPSVDYVLDTDALDLIALPLGSLINSSANISYKFEKVLAQGVDYEAEVHVESLNERIGNKLVALNAVQPLNTPITNVFRIFNETTGELYNVLRWSDNTIFFTYNNPPNIQLASERASFQDELNETLFINSVINVSTSENIFKFLLSNDNIISESQDCIGSSINTTVKFSNSNVFIQEIYFDNNLTVSQNQTRLKNIGDYQIDYINGIVWVLVSSNQSTSVGSVSYKRGYISPNFPHVITVQDIYYQLSSLGQKTKHFSYTNFSDGNILPSSFDISNETFLNNDSGFPYLVFNNQIGTFNNAAFTPGVANFIKNIRGVFEYEDILNNTIPINFAPSSTFNGNTITVDPLVFNEYHSVQFDGTNYYVLLNTPLLYLSSNITINIQVQRLSDSAQLWNASGKLSYGNPLKLVLPGINSPKAGDPVLVTYSYTINNLSRVIVDYNKGDYYIDYTYLSDEILISYEYGDNVLDFRQSNALSTNQTYYVTYKVGALRDALLKNFGTLIDLPLLNDLDVTFERENYRNALIAAMQSFTAGPTVASIKNIVETIVKTPPQIVESAFQNWVLGQSTLNLQPVATTGAFKLAPAKYGNGVVIDQPGQTISFPVSSNLRLEEGSLETWVVPEWNGIDNQASISVTVLKNGVAIPAQEIYIGPAGAHPEYPSGSSTFALNATNNMVGIPNEHKNGVFIYYAPDITGVFDRWYIDVTDGYSAYSINVTTNGKFYDVKSDVIPAAHGTRITSGNTSFNFYTDGNAGSTQGVTFIADNQHFIFDYGEDGNKNRFSLFKDESGYLNFRVVDRHKNYYTVSADVSSWSAGQIHHVATSWSIGSRTKRDELHLFIDGLEVPNIIKYNSKVSPYLHEKYRTVDPEEIVGLVTRPIVGYYDLVTQAGSSVVTSFINFTAEGVSPGDILYIGEPGFNAAGYTITAVNGQSLMLSTPTPVSAVGANYTVNKTSFTVQTAIDLYPNIAVSLMHVFTAQNTQAPVEGSDLQISNGSTIVTSPSINFASAGVSPGFVININEAGFAQVYTIVAVNGNSLTLTDPMPSTITAAQFFVYASIEQEIPGQRALHPAYELSRDANFNNVLTIIGNAQKNDIVLIRTLGLNHKLVKQNYYVWDGYVPSKNVIMTQLPPPILLGDVSITHILLSPTNIGPTNSTLLNGKFISSQILTDQPSVSDNGRTLSVNITGGNINYASSVVVSINGTVNNVANVIETVSFTSNSTAYTTNKFQYVNYITVTCTPLDTTKNCAVVEIEERYPITVPENSSVWPVVRFSYQVGIGTALVSNGTNIVSDPNMFFSSDNVGNYLIIYSPSAAAGQYQITAVNDGYLTLSNNVPTSFTNGNYQILNPSTYMSGLQNGFFTFENANVPGQPYNIAQGSYRFEYHSYLTIPLDVNNLQGYVGSDMLGNNQVGATLNQFMIVSEKLTDTRIGDIVQNSKQTITKDYNALKAFIPDTNTLMLLSFNSFPFLNSASIYATSSSRFIQSSSSVNDNFGKSIVVTRQPVVVDNSGILITKQEGTIEFWVSPLFDTGNDPNYRYYFDASGTVSENVISINNVTVTVAGLISSVSSVKLQVGYGTQKTDYFSDGMISPDGHTIYLKKPLPNQNTPVVVNYVPTGVQGDRISIYKDPSGYVNFDVVASGTNYTIRAPTFWTAGSWHRLKASFKFNKGLGSDEIRFFVDGYERGNVLFGGSLLFGQNQVFGSSFIGPNGIQASVSFKDTINELFIGSDYTGNQQAFALIDNLRISNVSRPLFAPFGESIDVNYSSNLDVVLPVTTDLYTTLLLDFDSLVSLNTNFTTLKDRNVGLFDFTVNIFDSFGIINNSTKVKQVLENLIDTLKPANSFAVIKYIS